MTEEEANTKWCPMVNHVNGQMQQCGNHMTGVPVSQTFNACIGSACMMWREAINGAGQGKSSFYCELGGKP